MKRRTGTVLGGPADGEIITSNGGPRLLMPRPVPLAYVTAEANDLPPAGIAPVDVYEWMVDDDARGWWVKKP